MRPPRSILLLLSLLSLTLPLQSQTYYAVLLGARSGASGLFRSTDEGRNWEHLGAPNLKAFSADAVDSSRGRVLYLAAGNGVHRSSDAGISWRLVSPPAMTEVLDVHVDQRQPWRVYAATAWGVWGSADGGDTWRRLRLSSGLGIRDSIRYSYRFVSTSSEVVILPHMAALKNGEVVREARREELSRRDALLSLLEGLIPSGTHDTSVASLIPEGSALYDVDRRIGMGGIPTEQVAFAGDSGILVAEWQTQGFRGGMVSPPSRMGPERHVVHAVSFLSDGRLLAGTWEDGIYRFEGGRWSQSGLAGGMVWRIIRKEW